MTEESGEKKLYVDEDWKSRVEAEREEVRARKESTAKEATGATDQGDAAQAVKMPPASFEILLSTLVTEAMVALGELPHPATGKAEVNLDHARYFIDTLRVLQEKTAGNLSPDEQRAIDSVVSQLQMAFVAAKNRPATPGGDAAESK